MCLFLLAFIFVNINPVIPNNGNAGIKAHNVEFCFNDK